jgi:NADH:ubiquinone oxidoreductase subunit 5 (subunit L)/multisubunit Na+/H+ antiporter MnhA subunit
LPVLVRVELLVLVWETVSASVPLSVWLVTTVSAPTAVAV